MELKSIGLSATGSVEDQKAGDSLEIVMKDGLRIVFRKPVGATSFTSDDTAASLEVSDDWFSPRTGRIYPTAFRLTLGGRDLIVRIDNPMAEVEEPDPYWAGVCPVLDGAEVVGEAHLECLGHPQMTERDMAVRWTKGDESAIWLFHTLARCSHYADDFVDEDVPERDRSRDMSRLLFNLTAILPNNAFYQKYRQALEPIIATAIIYWDASNTWGRAVVKESRMFGFVHREDLEMVIVMIGLLVGGQDWARRVVREVHDFYHVLSRATFEKWEAENGYSC